MLIKRQCTVNGCAQYAVTGSSRCEVHEKKEKKRRFAQIQKTDNIKKLYGSDDWKKLKALHIRTNPLCAECGRMGQEIHHKIKHNGDPVLFFDLTNLETLCRSCHSKKTLGGE